MLMLKTAAQSEERWGEVLKVCRTLAEADRALYELGVKSLALRTGLWDGFAGRPSSLAGLAPSSQEVPLQIAMDYRQGCEIGRKLSMSELPS